MTRLRALESERYIIAANYRSTGFKVMDVIRRHDGGLAIEFPYLDHAEKIVSLCTIPANRPRDSNVSLMPGGKLVSGPVMYRHSVSGKMGFFQPDSEVPVLEKMGPPLLETAGHVFSAQFQGINGFEPLPAEEMDQCPSADRTVLTFKFDAGLPPAIKVVGRSMSRHEILQQTESASPRPDTLGPVIETITSDGKVSRGFLLGTPGGSHSHEWLLLVDVHDHSKATPSRNPAIQFLGGFDSRGITADLSKTTTFLALSLPVDEADAKKLRHRARQ